MSEKLTNSTSAVTRQGFLSEDPRIFSAIKVLCFEINVTGKVTGKDFVAFVKGLKRTIFPAL